MMNYSGPDKKNSGSSFDNQDFGIYGRGYEGYAHYMQAVKESGSSISDDFPFEYWFSSGNIVRILFGHFCWYSFIISRDLSVDLSSKIMFSYSNEVIWDRADSMASAI